MTVRISQQIEAEHDPYLIDCFHDADFVPRLLRERMCFISGRKGTGKTGLCLYLQSKYETCGLDFSGLISLDQLGYSMNRTSENKAEVILLYILTRTVQLLLREDLLETGYKEYWQEYLSRNGVANIEDFKTFVTWAREHSTSMEIPIISRILPLAGSHTYQFQRAEISNSVSNIFSSFCKSLPAGIKIVITFDNISDYLDITDYKTFREDINVIRDVLLQLERFNSSIIQEKKDFMFVCTLRDDLWDYMEGSNVNKLKSNCLKLDWEQKSFCSVLIRRLPQFSEKLEHALEHPFSYIKKVFPDALFDEYLSSSQTKQYGTKFYAYMMAISFNRPRDFLKFCVCMSDRLSTQKRVIGANIKAAEIEYSDYLFSEIKDELSLVAKSFDFKKNLDLYSLMSILSNKEIFNSTELRSEMKKFLEENASNRDVYQFIYQLWLYGIIGFRHVKNDGPFVFKYMSEEVPMPLEDEVKEYSFTLHRGLLWSMTRRRAMTKAQSAN